MLEKLNHRKILDGIFEVCGVPTEKIRSISSAVDKLDKVGFPSCLICAVLKYSNRYRYRGLM